MKTLFWVEYNGLFLCFLHISYLGAIAMEINKYPKWPNKDGRDQKLQRVLKIIEVTHVQSESQKVE